MKPNKKLQFYVKIFQCYFQLKPHKRVNYKKISKLGPKPKSSIMGHPYYGGVCKVRFKCNKDSENNKFKKDK